MGADGLKALELPGQATIIGMIVLTAVVNLLIGSASAKWALLSPIMVPMLMAVGISPELTSTDLTKSQPAGGQLSSSEIMAKALSRTDCWSPDWHRCRPRRRPP